jgi:hypothetical protein
MKRILFGAILAATATASNAHVEDVWRHMAFTATGTYTKTTSDGLSIGDLLIQRPNASNPASGVNGHMDGGRRAVFLDPDYDGGYALGLSYHFHNSRTRLFLHYDYFRDHNEQDTVNIRNLGYQPGGLNPDGSTLASTEGHSRAEDHSEEWRIGFVHHAPLHPRVTVDSSFFFEYDRVSRAIHDEILGFDSSGSTEGSAERFTKDRVKGWGPGIGARTHLRPFHRHHLQGIGLFASVKTILLYTDNDFNEDYLETSEDDFYFYEPEQSHSLVGKLDISFGVDMTSCIFSSLGQLPFNVALGMRYMNMYDVFKHGNADYNPPQHIRIDPGTSHIYGSFAANSGPSSDWGRIGPFLQFRIGGSYHA